MPVEMIYSYFEFKMFFFICRFLNFIEFTFYVNSVKLLLFMAAFLANFISYLIKSVNFLACCYSRVQLWGQSVFCW